MEILHDSHDYSITGHPRRHAIAYWEIITAYARGIMGLSALRMSVLLRNDATVGIGYYDYLGTRQKNSH